MSWSSYYVFDDKRHQQSVSQWPGEFFPKQFSPIHKVVSQRCHSLYWQSNVLNEKYASFHDANGPTMQQRKHINLKLNLLYSLSPLKRMEGILTTFCTICFTFLPFDSWFWQFLCIFWLVIDSILLSNSDSRP